MLIFTLLLWVKASCFQFCSVGLNSLSKVAQLKALELGFKPSLSEPTKCAPLSVPHFPRGCREWSASALVLALLGFIESSSEAKDDDFVHEPSHPLAQKVLVMYEVPLQYLGELKPRMNKQRAGAWICLHLGSFLVSFLENAMASKEVPLLSEWVFLDGKSVTLLQGKGTSHPLHSLFPV